MNYSLWTKNRYFGQLLKTIVQSTTNMNHHNMVYQMELRLSFSQQLAEGLRGGGHQLTDLYVYGCIETKIDQVMFLSYIMPIDRYSHML